MTSLVTIRQHRDTLTVSFKHDVDAERLVELINEGSTGSAYSFNDKDFTKLLDDHNGDREEAIKAYARRMF